MNKSNLPLILIAISLLIVAVSIAYYLLIFIPSKEQTKLETQKVVEQKKEFEKVSISTKRENCIFDAEENYYAYWNKRGKELGTLNYVKNFKIEGVGSEQWKLDLDTNRKLSMEEVWVWDEQKQDWVVNRLLAQNVKLPSDEVERIDGQLKDKKEECFRLYPN